MTIEGVEFPWLATAWVTEWGDGGVAAVESSEGTLRITTHDSSGVRVWSDNLPPLARGDAIQPPIAITGNRRGDLAIVSFDGAALLPAIRSPTGSWRRFSGIPLNLAQYEQRAGPFIALDESGRLTVVFGGPNEMSASTFTADGSASPIVRIGPSTLRPVTLIFDSRGELHAIWPVYNSSRIELWANRLRALAN